MWNTYNSFGELKGVGVGGTGEAWGQAGARVSRSTAQSIATGTWATLEWTVEDFDLDGMADLATNNTRLTVATPGLYQLSATCNFAAKAGAQRYMRLRKNGSVVAYGSSAPGSTAEHAHMVVTHLDKCDAGDYFDVQVLQATGTATDTGGNGYPLTFSAVRVGYQSNPNALLPASTTSNSTVLTADNTVQDKAKWARNPGADVTTPATRTTDFSTGTINNSRSASMLSLTATGDNVTAMTVEFWAGGLYASSLAGSCNLVVELWDGTVGTGTLLALDDRVHAATGVDYGNVFLRRRIAAFSGSKTFNVAVRNATALNATFVVVGGATYPQSLSATWSA